jgi:hypothetical protein
MVCTIDIKYNIYYYIIIIDIINIVNNNNNTSSLLNTLRTYISKVK